MINDISLIIDILNAVLECTNNRGVEIVNGENTAERLIYFAQDPESKNITCGFDRDYF